MRKMKRVGGFLLSLLFNMLLNARGLIPAAVLLVLHYVLRVPIWLSFAALGIWIAAMIARMLFFGWALRSSLSFTECAPKVCLNRIIRSGGNACSTWAA